MSDQWCVCILTPGHGPDSHRCRCGNTWGIGVASPDCGAPLSADTEITGGES